MSLSNFRVFDFLSGILICTCANTGRRHIERNLSRAQDLHDPLGPSDQDVNLTRGVLVCAAIQARRQPTTGEQIRQQYLRQQESCIVHDLILKLVAAVMSSVAFA